MALSEEEVDDILGQLLSAFMLRRLKREVLQSLPAKTEALVGVGRTVVQAWTR